MRNLKNAIEKVKSYRGNLSKSIVCSTAKQTLNQYRRGWIKPEEGSDLAVMIAERGLYQLLETPLKDRKLDKAFTKQGLNWMRNFFFTSNGTMRKTKELMQFGDGARKDIEYIVKNFSHFTFDGFTDAGYDNGEVIPCWKVHAKDGQTFTYSYNGGRFNPNGGLNVSF